MSGLEIVGVVLGSIPLVISALEHYRDGLRTIQRWRKWDRELQSLIRNLETEQAKFQDICEKLLMGIVSPSRIEVMVEKPLGDLWMEKETQKKIRARLWRSWDVFERNLEDISGAIGEMMGRLDDGAKVCPSLGESTHNELTLFISGYLVCDERTQARKFHLQQIKLRGIDVKDQRWHFESRITDDIEH